MCHERFVKLYCKKNENVTEMLMKLYGNELNWLSKLNRTYNDDVHNVAVYSLMLYAADSSHMYTKTHTADRIVYLITNHITFF